MADTVQTGLLSQRIALDPLRVAPLSNRTSAPTPCDTTSSSLFCLLPSPPSKGIRCDCTQSVHCTKQGVAPMADTVQMTHAVPTHCTGPTEGGTLE
jgi:hypothetical protein